jgi:hypothetical protein
VGAAIRGKIVVKYAFSGFAQGQGSAGEGVGSEFDLARAGSVVESGPVVQSGPVVESGSIGEAGAVIIEAGSASHMAAAINAALADPAVTKVILGAGTFILEAPITVPSGKTLEGAGRDLTLLQVAPDFHRSSFGEEDGVVNSVRGSEDITLSGFSIDAGHIRPEGLRLHGCFMKDTANFSITEVDVYNSTGYAHFAAGSQGTPGIYTSGSYEDCETFSSSIHFEQMFCDGITLTDCHASDGDGVIRGIYYHPVLGSKNISYIDCTAYGTGVGVEMTADYILPLENISFINCDIEITSDSMALYAGGGNPHLNVQIINSSFVSHNQVAVILAGVTGTIVDSYIQGESSALVIWSTGSGFKSDIVATNSTALGIRNPDSNDGVSALVAGHSDGTIHWIGGTVEARGKAWVTNLFIGGSVTHTDDTKLITSGFGTMLFFTENDAAKTFAPPPLELGDVGAAGFDGATFTVRYIANDTPSDQLGILNAGNDAGQIGVNGTTVSYEGIAIGSVSGGANGTKLVVTLNGAATAEAVAALTQAITYLNPSDNPDALFRALAISIQDAAGGVAETSAAVIMTAVDDPTILHLNARTLMWTENAAPAAIASVAGVSDLDTNLWGSTLTVSFTEGFTPEDRLSILNSGNAAGKIGVAGDQVTFGGLTIGTVAGGTDSTPLVVSLGYYASVASVQALVRAIAYGNNSENPVDGLRTVTVEVRASSGATIVQSMKVDVTSVDDPLVPKNDQAVVAENANVIVDAAANDDPDGPAPEIVSVDGTALAAGGSVTIASGATVTLGADGRLTYDPGTAFLYLTDPGSGAANMTAADSFTYQLAGGGSATVEITVNGVTGPGDALLGSTGDDRITGTSEANLFHLNQSGADAVSGLDGDDTLFLGGFLDAADTLNGGAGADQAILQGEYDVALGEGTLSGIEALTLLSGGDSLYGGGGGLLSYRIVTHDGNVAAGSSLLVDFSGLQAGESVNFDGSAETNGRFIFAGGAGDDILAGGSGNNSFDGGAGADVMTGGLGDDLYLIDSLDDQVIEAADGGLDEVRTGLGSRDDFSAMYRLADSVEKLTGTSAVGQGVYANALDNVVAMGGGSDLVVLDAGGNDTVSGGGGSDFLYWGGAFTNEDQADGGLGFDTVGLLGTYAVAFDGDDLFSVEKLAVYSSGDSAAPNGYSLVMHDGNVGAGERMTVVALSLQANEVLNFNGVAETDGSFNVRGGRGADTIVGGSGNDSILGNLGSDTLTGGAGKDVFVYQAAAESTAEDADVIMDFDKGDKIDLSFIDADGNAANGDTKFSWLGSGAFTQEAGQLRVTQNADYSRAWVVEADIDGDGVADLVLNVVAPPGFLPEKSDFYV